MNRKSWLTILPAILLIICMLFSACNGIGNVGTNNGGANADGDTNASSGDTKIENLQIQLLQSDSDVTYVQEQLMSQIKAEYLLENNGYKADDQVVAIVMMKSNALLEDYNNGLYQSYSSVADYADSLAGANAISRLQKEQNKVISLLKDKGFVDSVICNYTTVTNAVAIQTKYGNLSKIENVSGVKSVILSDTYNQPKADADSNGDTSAIENFVDIYPTGIFNSSCVPYTGVGTSVAILDNGFDTSHSVFQTPLAEPNKVTITREDVASKLAYTKAKEITTTLDITNVYASLKIPYVYDYADKDSDVEPFSEEHGTHVAGIIGGKDDVITGVAVNTQLLLMKVFPDHEDGGKTEDILLALEDAVLFGVDAINMSLGSSCGFSREVDKEEVNDIYDRISSAGISLITAASNSYSAGYGGEQGNTNKVTNPDSGTVGSPSTYSAALSVASISGTKSPYLLTNANTDYQLNVFFDESNSITGEENNFYEELYQLLGLAEGTTKQLEYVTVPGVGLPINYSSIDVQGKIALVRRGDNTFEQKAAVAKEKGAIACIIYNNVEGDIIMSMGKTDHIPTISISKSDGELLAKHESGTITVSNSYRAGPFISDFSSWGPTPSLELKPEITAHGGNIKSAVHGGGYDEMSGTSMATPNLCGAVVLIRQYLKEKYPTKTSVEITTMANQLLMSTATIALNEEGKPYSPRKQGAGLASLVALTTTDGYITVDGTDKTKLELKDDPNRTGVYTMNFNVVNTSANTLVYNLSVVGMTETVSSSDDTFVAETPYILSGNTDCKVNGAKITDGKITVAPNTTAKVVVTYTLTNADKEYLDAHFPYGMYVEGFVKLTQVSGGENIVNLNAPFLAFYGDWTQAPMLDKTYYEVDPDAQNPAIDYEDKVKADYFATTPYGSYYYNYIIPLGTYLYDMASGYDVIPASLDHIAISDTLGTIDGISTIYAGLLRGAKQVQFTLTDKLTGEVVWQEIDYNAIKAYSNGATAIPYYSDLRVKSAQLGLVNNRVYQFSMVALLDDYFIRGEDGDGGLSTNVRNTFTFDITFDNEAPVLNNVSYEKQYDKTLKKDRYFITLDIYDNHYPMSVAPIIFTSSSTYGFLTDNPIPVYAEESGATTSVRFEITSYLDDIKTDALINSALAFYIDDYALNGNIYLCQLPGTKGDFKFTKNGEYDGIDYIIHTVEKGSLCDLTQYLATSDATVDADKDFLKHLVWSTSNESIITCEQGILNALEVGRATVTVSEQMDGKQAVIIINVVESSSQTRTAKRSQLEDTTVQEAELKEIRFAYFDTLFAYSRAAQTSEIGSTGSRFYISSLVGNTVSFYPGEKIQLAYELNPWYVADKYQIVFESSNPAVANIDQDGIVIGLKEGSTWITAKVQGSTLLARIKVTIKSPFVIENRTLVAYKGLGGEVVIPDDEGILIIGSYAFCLYDTDQTVELPEDDYDANKIPNANTSITSVVIPYGVTEIQKYAFYNCSALRSVTIPESVTKIGDFCFYNDVKLESVNYVDQGGNAITGKQAKLQSIGDYCFTNCEKLATIDLSNMYSIGVQAFKNCKSLTSATLTALRNTGTSAFENCEALSSVTLAKETVLADAMFVNTALVQVDIYNQDIYLPQYIFANNKKLTTVRIHNDIYAINLGAFSGCEQLTTVEIKGSLDTIGEQAFYNCTNLQSFTLPNNAVTIDDHAFYKCEKLSTISLQANTVIKSVGVASFKDTSLVNVITANDTYTVYDGIVYADDGATIVLVTNSDKVPTDFIVPNSVTKIADGAFNGSLVESVTFNSNCVIGNHAFGDAGKLHTVNFANGAFVIGDYAFCGDIVTNQNKTLTNVVGLENATHIGDYAFAFSGIKVANIGANAVVGEGAFFRSAVVKANIGANATLGMGAFQRCLSLTEVFLSDMADTTLGFGCFSYDTELQSINLSQVTAIPDQCFYRCTSLIVANLSSAKTIGDLAFAHCSSLSRVDLAVVESIGMRAFGIHEQDGPSAPTFMEINLPETLVSIGNEAFFSCAGLQTVTLPSSIDYLAGNVGYYVFGSCVSLHTVTLPQNLTVIGEGWFYGCERLYSINLENVEYFGDYAFYGCNKESTNNFVVDISSAVAIGECAFADCYLYFADTTPLNDLVYVDTLAFQYAKINSFVAPNLQYIGQEAFEYCTNLKQFAFSNNVAYVGAGAFLGCTGIEKYTLGNDNVIYHGTINDYALLDNGVLYTRMENGNWKLSSVPAGMTEETLTVMEGTTYVDMFAGSQNEKIKNIIFPDSLKSIGDHAFYGCKKLQTVEFRSETAPVLENSYIDGAYLEETDPGYQLLYNYYDLFGLSLCYYNFIDLVGKKQPIVMILPANEDINGYDSIVYQAYFGTVAEAERSSYVARQDALVKFLDYGSQVANLDTITLANEQLVNDALTAYNAVTQNYKDFGISDELWNNLVTKVKDAKRTISYLALVTAPRNVQQLQVEIDSLSTTFTIDKFSQLQDISQRINSLTKSHRAMLVLDNYNALLASYNEYLQSITMEVESNKNAVDSTAICIIATANVALAGLYLGLKKFF